jgi:apolipoprotein N-acyltransferase
MTRKSKRKHNQASLPTKSTNQRPLSQCDRGWKQGVLLPAMASAALLWMAAPPLAWGLLAWLAPLGWLWVCARETRVGARGYWALWLSGCLFWLLVLHGIRLAYWPLIFGWLSLSLYLAVYIPAFVAATRAMRWRWGWPLVVAAPIAWLGLELIRSYMLTGYAANSLANTQVHFPMVIQMADQLGGGGISFVMMTASAAIMSLLQPRMEPRLVPQTDALALTSDQSMHSVGAKSVWGPAWAGLLLVAMFGYGWWRLHEADHMQAEQAPLLRVLLLQENTPSIFDNYSAERNQQSWNAYLELTRLAAAEYASKAPIDLVVWPESTFTANEPWVEADVGRGLSAELKSENVDEERLMAYVSDMQRALSWKSQMVIEAVRRPALADNDSAADSANAVNPSRPTESIPTWPYLLVGNDAWIYTSERVERYNSALWIGPDAQLLDRYSKMHLVMFGEYIPLGPLLQWLQDLVGLAGADAGREVKSFSAGRVRVAPNICFESMMPRVINSQVRTLVAQGQSPDVLINITNDSWFRGSTMLDHHLASSQLCAVENRRPLLVAANTGLTASIDSSGRVLQLAERLTAEAILAEPQADSRWGMVQSFGYPLSWLCAAITVLALLSLFRVNPRLS